MEKAAAGSSGPQEKYSPARVLVSRRCPRDFAVILGKQTQTKRKNRKGEERTKLKA